MKKPTRDRRRRTGRHEVPRGWRRSGVAPPGDLARPRPAAATASAATRPTAATLASAATRASAAEASVGAPGHSGPTRGSGGRGRPRTARHRQMPDRRRDLVLSAILIGLVGVLFVAFRGVAPPNAAAADVDATVADAGTSVTAATAAGTPAPTNATDGVVQGRPSPAAGRAASAVPEAGTGRIRLLDIPGQDSKAVGRQVRYTVGIENGLRVRIDDFPATVRSVLVGRRGWESVEDVRFVAVSPRQAAAGVRPDIQIVLASPRLVDAMCRPLKTHGEVSCYNNGRVVLNARRWWAGAPTYGDNVEAYRIYLVNHEVGHALGHGHVGCPGRRQNAPVMLQQTLHLNGCRAYPYPR